MTRERALRALEGLHIALLGWWCAALAMTAATAAILFPTMRDLAPTLPAYSGHQRDHWVIAAGAVMERVFTVMDVTQLAVAGLACVVFVPVAASCRQRPALTAVRAGVLGALLLSVAQYTFVLRSEMASALLQFWASAEAGDAERAEAARAVFDGLHPKASSRLAWHLAGAVLALGLSVLALARTGGGGKAAPAS